MGAIAGIVGSNHVDIDRMADAMAHRAGGAMAVLHPASGVSLASSAVREPRHLGRSAATNVFIVADARIDDRAQITRTLGLPGHSPDDEIILHAYLTWGRDCVRHLLGDFAFAIWDGRQNRIFCARDHVGIKPFYFANVDGRFGFATEVPALISGFDRPFNPDLGRIAEYLARQALSADATMFAEIRSLPAAHTLTYDVGGRLETSRYWTLDRDREVRYDTSDQYEEAFRHIFETAVQDRMQPARRPGIMLSGGMDSSAVACVARDLASDGKHLVPTFTARFGYSDADESVYIDALRDQEGFEMSDVDLHGADPLDSVDKVVRSLGQPSYICNAYMYSAINTSARAAGVDVLLDGCEGDVSLSYGLGRIGELVLSGSWASVEQEIAALSSTTGAPMAQLFRQHAEPFLPARLGLHPIRFPSGDVRHAARLGRRSALRLLAGTGRTAWHAWRGGLPPVPLTAGLVSRELLEHTRLVERIGDSRPAISPREFSEQRRHWSAFHHDAPGIATLQEEASHLHAMHGGEARHPFYDIRLIEFCVGVPSDQKLRDGYTRSILRRSLKHTLPDVIRRRMTKGDLSENFIRAVNADAHGRVRSMVNDRVGDLKDYVDIDTLRSAFSSGDAPSMYTVLSFLTWKDNFLNTPPGPSRRHQLSGTMPEIAMS